MPARPRNGSTRHWKKTRAAVLARDGHRCQVRVDHPALQLLTPGPICGKPATHCGHWPIAHTDGGPDTPDNLRAECDTHSHQGGGAIAERNRRDRAGFGYQTTTPPLSPSANPQFFNRDSHPRPHLWPNLSPGSEKETDLDRSRRRSRWFGPSGV